MNKEIKITPPDGFVVDTEKSTFERIVFKEVKKDVKDRIKTFDDVCRETGTTEKEFEEKYKNILDEQGYANEQIKVICKAFNEGWTSNWDDSNEYKYFVWFNMRQGGSFDDCYSWNSNSEISTRLCFKTGDLATYAGRQFEDIFRAYFLG